MTKHTAIITPDRATCSCKRWPAVERRDGESVGAFTWRASGRHEDHVHGESDGSQVSMFESALPVPAFGLFAD